MNVLVLSHTDVTRLLTMEACIEVMADALRATSQGGAVLPVVCQSRSQAHAARR